MILYQNFKGVADKLEEYDFNKTYRILLYFLNKRFDYITVNSIHTMNNALKRTYFKRLCKDIREGNTEINFWPVYIIKKIKSYSERMR